MERESVNICGKSIKDVSALFYDHVVLCTVIKITDRAGRLRFPDCAVNDKPAAAKSSDDSVLV